jgi:16S rRNA (cytosine967-C5)-methyltransferase
MQLRPDTHGTDGFFAAVFERRKGGAQAASAAAASEAVEQAAEALAPEESEADLEPESRLPPVSDPTSGA